MTNPDFTYDAFVVRKLSNFELGEENWKENQAQIEFPEANSFGASADGSNDDDWEFQELG